MVWWARFQPRHASHSHLFVRVAPQAKQSVQESTGGWGALRWQRAQSPFAQ